ncbi:MAG TPA: ribosome silencing factor [Ottowia sp.]|uniref:ribosome silencing factor n=1 Tax=Ottowia sp. TaxID=1898956 RepID=UPI002B556689|nr:ribosome silencing factor [Ottowia sp.]HMN21498.1 ribosome silencing factor [Ottowia sp.]
MSEAAAKKDIQRLQRAIVDGLEDIKGQDIRVFNTEHLSPLFERVIVASGTSNRQTQALAASVRDKVRDAGFAKPRLEGEENGEWIIVDCGAAVAHVMQPAIRQYYNLEEIWGDKPVRMRLGATAVPKAPRARSAGPAGKVSPARAQAAKTPAAKAPAGKVPVGKVPAGKVPAGKAVARKAAATPVASPKAPAKAAPARAARSGAGYSAGGRATSARPAGPARGTARQSAAPKVASRSRTTGKVLVVGKPTGAQSTKPARAAPSARKSPAARRAR